MITEEEKAVAKKKCQLISKIADRAIAAGINLHKEKISLVMDILAADDEFSLSLGDLLTADDQNFYHDILGIQHNLNRHIRKMDNYFVPRYSTNQQGGRQDARHIYHSNKRNQRRNRPD